MSIILQTKGLSKIYGKGDNEVRALNKCDVTFREGSFTSIVGRSGSGKSTLMHLLGGLDTPTTGSVLIEGRNIYDMSDSERTIFRRRRIGFVFQFYNLMPELTAYQNILLPIQLDNQFFRYLQFAPLRLSFLPEIYLPLLPIPRPKK